jgi:hypothetical protein
MKKITYDQMPKDLKSVYYNQSSGAHIYQSESNGKFYWSESFGDFESESLEELIKEEKKIDPRMGWN